MDVIDDVSRETRPSRVFLETFFFWRIVHDIRHRKMLSYQTGANRHLQVRVLLPSKLLDGRQLAKGSRCLEGSVPEVPPEVCKPVFVVNS